MIRRPARWAALDGVRAIAILLVIPHNADIYPADPGPFWPLAIGASVGWIGVQLFFVLSGFLITGQLLDAVGSPHYFRDFYLRRALRILPLYYLTLFVGLILLRALSIAPPLSAGESSAQVWLWLFLNNWVQPFGSTVHGFEHFWSLAVEEQFYLVWPFIVLACREAGLLRACVAALVLAVLTRTSLFLAGTTHDANYMFTICRMDALALGAIAALLVRRPAATARIVAHGGLILSVTMAGLAALALATHAYGKDDPVLQLAGYSLLALGFAAGIVACCARADGTGHLARATAGDRSAAGGRTLQLRDVRLPPAAGHRPDAVIRHSLAGAGPALPLLVALLVGIATFVAAAISYHVFEKHLLALKERIAPRIAQRS
ncbi:MAG: acyltransferase [Steroidobacteraceae bacterium]